MKGLVLALLLGGLGYTLSQCPVTSNLPSRCHYNCSELICSSSSFPALTSRLEVDQCSDPLALSLSVDLSGNQFTQEYQVGGPREVTLCKDYGSIQLHTTFSRNTTHLMIRVMGIYSGDIAIDVIPSVSLPLTPHSCMCQSLESVADNFSIFLPLRYNCSRDQDCTSVVCTFPDYSDATVKLTFDPCSESVIMSGLPSGSVVFNQTEDRDFEVQNTPFTVHVELTNYNYSMNISATASVASVPFGQVQLLPPIKVVLDRSSCDSDLTYYPGPAPPTSVCTHGGTGGTVPPTTMPPYTTTPTKGTGGTSLVAMTTPTLPSDCPFMVIPPFCLQLVNCSGIICVTHYATAVMVVDKCSDPLTVDLIVRASGSSDPLYIATHYVGGPEGSSFYEPLSGIRVSYNRNTTHLNFTASGVFEGDIAVLIIPDVEFPLDPHTCTCQTLTSTASKVALPPQVGFTLKCTTDQNCSSIDCALSQTPVNVLFHPCHEVVIITGTNQVVFNQTETKPFSEGLFNVTAEVTLINHNYSMEFKLSFIVQGVTIPIVPLSHVSLDRSSCDSGSLSYYPGDPPESVVLIPHASTSPLPPVSVTASTSPPPPVSITASTSPPPPVSITAIAVSVPLLAVVSLVVIVTVVVCVFVALRRRKRSAGAYSFKELTEDDDYEPDA